MFLIRKNYDKLQKYDKLQNYDKLYYILENKFQLDLSKYNDIRNYYYNEIGDQFIKYYIENISIYFKYSLNKKTEIIIEKQERTFNKDSGKRINPFAIHKDSEGPASRSCITCIIYYNIDENIKNNYLEFYTDKQLYLDRVKIYEGLVISFNDVYHNASDYYTDSDNNVNRNCLTIFIIK